MIFQLPFFNTPNFSYSVNLDGRIFVFDFKFNTRAEHYIFDLFTEDREEPLYRGVRLILNQPLFLRWRRGTMPQGELIVICPRNLCPKDPQRASFVREEGPLRLIYRGANG